MRTTRTAIRSRGSGARGRAGVAAPRRRRPPRRDRRLQAGGLRRGRGSRSSATSRPEGDRQVRGVPRYQPGALPPGLWLRFFTPDEKYSGVIGGRQWGLQDQEYHLSFERLGRWEAGFEWDQMRHVFSTNARTLANETVAGSSRCRIRAPRSSTTTTAPSIDEISVALGYGAHVPQAQPVRNADLRRVHAYPQGRRAALRHGVRQPRRQLLRDPAAHRADHPRFPAAAGPGPPSTGSSRPATRCRSS